MMWTVLPRSRSQLPRSVAEVCRRSSDIRVVVQAREKRFHAPHVVVWRKLPCASAHRQFEQTIRLTPSQAGKVAVITGTTTGLGLIAAREFARKGGDLVLLNLRSDEQALESSMAAITACAKPGVTVLSIPCDLADFSSVRQAAALVKDACPDGISVLCNNAGVYACTDTATVDGFDIQMQINFLSHFLLTRELMPLLLASSASEEGEARIIQQTSVARSIPKLPLSAQYLGRHGGHLGGNCLGLLNDGARCQRYQQSKLANAVFHYALHDRLVAAGSNVKALLAHPGVSRTNLWSGDTGITGAFLCNVVGSPPEEGAVPLLHCMCSDAVEGGDFWGPTGWRGFSGPLGRIAPEPWCTDPESKAMLWEESSAAIGSSFEVAITSPPRYL